MFRKASTKVDGSPFSPREVEAVWQKGQQVPREDPRKYRRDRYGNLIQRDAYGRTETERGWEIDHIRPVAKQGSDDLGNLQPLQWRKNREKADSYPY